jgi:SAM-dependent methyltransferase
MDLPSIKSCDRTQFILDRIKDKKVLHLGCADWPFTSGYVKDGLLLHQKMKSVARELVGTDLEPEGIQVMQAAGIKNVVVGNSEQLLFETLGDKFDVIVAGEIIEHVLNPGLFLDSIKSVCHEDSIVILTTVNFAPIKKLPRLLFRREVVHPDHVYYFSFSTLSCLLTKSGYQIEEWATHWWDVGLFSKIVNRFLRRIPALQYFADNFCLVCRPVIGT